MRRDIVACVAIAFRSVAEVGPQFDQHFVVFDFAVHDHAVIGSADDGSAVPREGAFDRGKAEAGIRFALFRLPGHPEMNFIHSGFQRQRGRNLLVGIGKVAVAVEVDPGVQESIGRGIDERHVLRAGDKRLDSFRLAVRHTVRHAVRHAVHVGAVVAVVRVEVEVQDAVFIVDPQLIKLVVMIVAQRPRIGLAIHVGIHVVAQMHTGLVVDSGHDLVRRSIAFGQRLVAVRIVAEVVGGLDPELVVFDFAIGNDPVVEHSVGSKITAVGRETKTRVGIADSRVERNFEREHVGTGR